MKLVVMTCPACGAHINVPAGQSGTYCQFCGTQIYMDDEVQRVEQHIRYDNAEDAGYSFEKGRIRAQRESGQAWNQANSYPATESEQPQQPIQQKNSMDVWKMILWGLVWLCMFPIPLTIALKKRDMDAELRKRILVGSWLVYGALVIIGGLMPRPESARVPTEENVAQEGVPAKTNQTVKDNSETRTKAEETMSEMKQESEKGTDTPAQINTESTIPDPSEEFSKENVLPGVEFQESSVYGPVDLSAHQNIRDFVAAYNKIAEFPIQSLEKESHSGYHYRGMTSCGCAVDLFDYSDSTSVDGTLWVRINRVTGASEVSDWDYPMFRDIVLALDPSNTQDSIYACYYTDNPIGDNGASVHGDTVLGGVKIDYHGQTSNLMSPGQVTMKVG